MLAHGVPGRFCGNRNKHVSWRNIFKIRGVTKADVKMTPGVRDEPRVLRAMEFARLLRREVPVRGRDYCDMTSGYERPLEDFELLNVMLPRTYLPALRGNIYEQRAAAVVKELLGDGFALDYDQLVANNQNVTLRIYPEEDHSGTVLASMADSTPFLRSVFAG